jgi:hypothetical protein
MPRLPTLHALRKLRSLAPREWRDLIAAQVTLLRAQWRLRRRPVGTLVTRDAAANGAAAGDPARAREVALAVSRAADFGVFRPYCLVRAMALQDMLAANGVHGSNVRVGVRRENGNFSAHAWVVWRDEILGDHPTTVARFTEVDDLRVLTGK